MTKKLAVGLVGCGRWGSLILRDLVSLGCDVTVVSTSETGRQNAREGGATLVANHIDQLVEVDGAIVATPTQTHADVIESLLPLKVPIFTEKPMTADPESALRLAAQAPERLFVMDKWRYHAGVAILHEIANSEELGAVHGLRTTRGQWGNPHNDVDISWTLTPHDLSIALEIFGRIPTPRHAFAESSDGQVTSLWGLLGGELDDQGEPWLIVEVSSRHPKHSREIRLHCSEGVAILDDAYSPGVSLARAGNLPAGQTVVNEFRPISQEMPLLRELRTFVAHLQGGPPPRSSAAEGALIVSAIAGLRALAGLEKH